MNCEPLSSVATALPTLLQPRPGLPSHWRQLHTASELEAGVHGAVEEGGGLHMSLRNWFPKPETKDHELGGVVKIKKEEVCSK